MNPIKSLRRLLHGPPIDATFYVGSRLRICVGRVDTVATVKAFHKYCGRLMWIRSDKPVPIPQPLPYFPGYAPPGWEFWIETGPEIVSVIDRWGLLAGLSFSRGSTPHIVAARLKAIDLAGIPVLDTNSRLGRRAFCELAGTMLDRLGLQDVGIYNRPRGNVEFTIPGRNDWQHDPDLPAAWGTDAASRSNAMCQARLHALLSAAFPLIGAKREDGQATWGFDVQVTEINWLARARRSAHAGQQRSEAEIQRQTHAPGERPLSPRGDR